MACEAVRAWTLSGLIAAFIDLAIVYTLLCASAVAFFASKFLSFFGLHLPCPCNGVFFNIRSQSFCLNRLLVEFPNQIVSHVVLSVKENFPFRDSIKKTCNYNYSTHGEICVNGVVEMEGEASCSSLSDARKPDDVIRIGELSGRAEKYDLKGKGVICHRPKSRLRRLRKGGGGFGKNSVARGVEPYPNSRGEMGASGLVGGISLMGDYDAGVRFLEYDDKASATIGVTERAVVGIEMNPSQDEDIVMNRKTLSIEELQNDQQEVQTLTGDEEGTIRLLEQRLEKERTARAALYVELEKERSAAASAADEAMAMILRLQEDKASVEMESRQYQRILEEKSVYDAEEMTILKEILIRKEKETHFLEKEVEAYRQMVSVGDKQIAGDDFDPNDGVVSMDKPTSKLSFGNESFLFEKQVDSDEQSVHMSVCSSAGNTDLQEKQIISVIEDLQLISKGPQDCEKGSYFREREVEQIQELSPGPKPAEKVIASCCGTENDDRHCGPNLKQQAEDTYLGLSNSCDSTLDKDPRVYDVQVDGINLCGEANADKSNQLLVSDSKEDHQATDFPSSSVAESEFDVKKSNSDITRGFPPMVPKGLSLHSERRKSSPTPVDREMVKLHSELGCLQERLKLVQVGREKLSLSGKNQERENLQLKLLEDIGRQVQEIRRLTETRKPARQVSLPLPNSKAASKKRRSRSVSSGSR